MQNHIDVGTIRYSSQAVDLLASISQNEMTRRLAGIAFINTLMREIEFEMHGWRYIVTVD